MTTGRRCASASPHDCYLALIRQGDTARGRGRLPSARCGAGEVSNRLLRLAVGRVDLGHARRLGPVLGSVVARIGPELACLGAPAARVQHGWMVSSAKSFSEVFSRFNVSAVT